MAFLIGAGASHGCGRVEPEPPPLGDSLYGWLREHSGTWRAIGGPLHDSFTEHFEQGMYEAWMNYSDTVQDLLVDMARAFAAFKPPSDGSDLYTLLLRSLIANRVLGQTVFASLNYECVLDQAAWNLGLPVSYTSRGRQKGAVVVLKPHGSCNLLPDTGTNVFEDIRFSNVGHYFEGPVAPVPLARIEQLEHGSLPPAMSLYAPGKHTPVAHEWVARVRDEWRKAAIGSYAIAVIGVRPIWDDTHIWQPIIESKAHVWYVGGDADHQTLVARVTRSEHLGRTFDEAISPLGQRLKALG
jgi:hypothetical protein